MSWEKIKSVFQDAMEQPQERRSTFIQESCGHDEHLRARVESLVSRYTSPRAKLLNSPLASPIESPCFPFREGQQLGEYRLLRLLGRGGMGIVFKALQTKPNRHVALKLLQPHLLSKDYIHRFDREAHTLAKLQHPGIAQIFQAGNAPSLIGPQPFFAMELVEGKPITKYAKERALSLRQRLELLIQVAHAVQFAHQQGVIHRDLKPENILITALGQPKILDFGIARVMNERKVTLIRQTQLGQALGTIPYMSPEQLHAKENATDHRSDLYSLAVIGYELLAGFPLHRFENTSLGEALHLLTHEEISPLGKLRRDCRGDLETIFIKALEKNTSHRYSDVAQFAADLERYLSHQPIQARPQSTGYLLYKLVSRHKLASTFAASFFLAVIGFSVLTLLHKIELTQERDRALLAEKNATAQALRSEFEAKKSQEVVSFWENTLKFAGPRTKHKKELTVRDLLDDAKKALENRASPQLADLEATIRTVLGMSYYNVMQNELAEEEFRKALEFSKNRFGVDSSERAKAEYNLGSFLVESGNFAEAEVLLKHAISIQRKSPTEYLILSLIALGRCYSNQENAKEALPHFQEAYDLGLLLLGPEHPLLVEALTRQTLVFTSLSETENAERCSKLVESILEKNEFSDRGQTVRYHEGRVEILTQKKELESAKEQALLGFELSQEIHGEESAENLRLLFQLSRLSYLRSEKEKQNDWAKKALRIAREPGNEKHLFRSLMVAGDSANAVENFESAVELYREALQFSKKFYGENHSYVPLSLSFLVGAYYSAGEKDKAEQSLLELLQISQQEKTANPTMAKSCLSNLAILAQERGDQDAAARYTEEAESIR